MLPTCGIQQNPDGLLGLGTEHNRARINFVRLPSISVDIKNAPGAVAIDIHQNPVNHRVRNQGAISGLNRVGHSGERRIKVRTSLTSALAGTAVMTRSSPVDRTSEVGGAGRSHRPSQFFLGSVAE